jgi:pseudouridine-5'-phosphate glycosidase
VLGYRTDELPLFYAAGGGPPVSARVESADEAAHVARAHWELGGGGLLLANPPENGIDVEPLVEDALKAAEQQNVTGQAVTPFVLSYLHDRSGGRTLEVNRELVVANAQLAAKTAVAFAAAG